MQLIYGNILGWTSSSVMFRLSYIFQSLATKHLCVLFQLLLNFNFMGHFHGNLEKQIASREHLNFFIVNSKKKGRTNKISLKT